MLKLTFATVIALVAMALGGVALAVDRAPGDVDEVPLAGVDGRRPAGTVLHAQRAHGDVDRRLVVAVVVPAGEHPGLGVGEPGPHAVARDRLLAAHPRGGIGVDAVGGPDVAELVHRHPSVSDRTP